MSPLKAACALALTTALSLAAVPAHATWKDPGPENELDRTYAATSKYRNLKRAIKDDYLRNNACVALLGEGGMGYHYVKQQLINSTDPAQPAGLAYHKDKKGKKRLGAVEWIVRDADQNVKTDWDRPVMFGDQKFDGPEEIPGLGVVYTLHAWIYKDNPRGVFYPWNPRVTCP
ncbi:hypothetical protein [Streptomyces lomondensis]|uniref:Uncharacterized protein n=1 Tax=Streptomyces lomondensis TaxID=68229 RepID=A0ABQ2X1J4_9ACTN|nr:hypothetical protein [Streptomyces lomondensis]MCF0081697.1 hypothetical protein [Streptomyces lomondensis]GGW91755.1 hypothetical protein GCM10010383_21930 [Streptomyces lomondensis]